MGGDAWRLTFIPEPGGVPIEARIRGLLKHALRVRSLRCVGVESIDLGSKHQANADRPIDPGTADASRN